MNVFELKVFSNPPKLFNCVKFEIYFLRLNLVNRLLLSFLFQIVEKDLEQIKKARVDVNKQAKEMLKSGLNSQVCVLLCLTVWYFLTL